jgi:beta-phosphoglucomutase-like phosphatase (HAD superfamily)
MGKIRVAGETPKAKKPTSRPALLFELEHSAIQGRKIIFDVLKNALEERDVKLTEELYRRHCLRPSVQRMVTGLLGASGKTRLSVDRMISQVAEGMRLSLTDGTVKLNPAMAAVIKEAVQKNIALGALTALDEATARQLLTHLGLDQHGVIVHCFRLNENEMAGADVWRRLAKTMATPPSQCMVLATDHMMCRAALFAGICCTAVPDEYTLHQDFSGADFLVNKLDVGALHRMMEMIEAR